MLEWGVVLEAVGSAQSADRAAARARLSALWEQTDVPAQRCVVAHFLADVQERIDDEVRWDEAAFEAFGAVTDADLTPIGVPAAAGLLPSLHLNLGDGYLRQGRLADARAQAELARAALDVLGDDGYGAMVRRGLDSLEARLAVA